MEKPPAAIEEGPLSEKEAYAHKKKESNWVPLEQVPDGCICERAFMKKETQDLCKKTKACVLCCAMKYSESYNYAHTRHKDVAELLRRALAVMGMDPLKDETP
jgi:hypothetical protein